MLRKLAAILFSTGPLNSWETAVGEKAQTGAKKGTSKLVHHKSIT